jgi:antitoxin component YwqK of YwqJK toxin-antitoxin module
MKIFWGLLLFISTVAYGQTPVKSGDTIFNQTDKQGLKQGYWKGFYENKKIKYTGYFKDNKPVGTFKRYYDEGILKAIMEYDKTGTRTFTTLYYQNGTKAAEGIYKGTSKDSVWNYYSYYEKTLSNRENYKNGKKEGRSTSYYASGSVSQEIDYRNDVKDGIWKQYFENANLKLSATYVAGKRTGDFILNYPNNIAEWKGKYIDDKKEGNWTHYNPDGSKDSEIEFVNGIAKNAEELDKKEQEMLKLIEKKKGSIPEPDENSFAPGM